MHIARRHQVVNFHRRNRVRNGAHKWMHVFSVFKVFWNVGEMLRIMSVFRFALL